MPQLPQPKLPEPAHPDVDSMLSRRFGKEVANYFSGMLCEPRNMTVGSNQYRFPTEPRLFPAT